MSAARTLIDRGVKSPSPVPGEGRGPPRSGGKGEGLGTKPCASGSLDHPSPSRLRRVPPSPGTGEGISTAHIVSPRFRRGPP
ncbi:hypothetical protein E6C67_09945 [Azospirillum sp. TSA2s]|nr:hypothetical protein E6C67_09945 [Azospirillum sp. TSA2s]